MHLSVSDCFVFESILPKKMKVFKPMFEPVLLIEIWVPIQLFKSMASRPNLLCTIMKFYFKLKVIEVRKD